MRLRLLAALGGVDDAGGDRADPGTDRPEPHRLPLDEPLDTALGPRVSHARVLDGRAQGIVDPVHERVVERGLWRGVGRGVRISDAEQQRVHHGAEPLRAREAHPAACAGGDAHRGHAANPGLIAGGQPFRQNLVFARKSTAGEAAANEPVIPALK
jgi:hypothetical protein